MMAPPPMNKQTLIAIIRWMAAAGFFFLALRWLAKSGPTGMFPGLFLLIVGVKLLSPELVEWVSMPIQAVFNSILWPGDSDPPPLDYTLARFYCQQGRYEEAVEQYFRLLRHHPRELAAYLEGIAAAFDANAPESARKFYRKALWRLRLRSEREEVRRAFERAGAHPGQG